MTKLSVNINKIATLRNARGGDTPNVLEAALNAERFGAEGITIHPRPDQRHIRYTDVEVLSKNINTELNIEGRPNKAFMDLVLKIKPDQVTLVPDEENAITSNAGWDTKKNQDFLQDIVSALKSKNIRVSIFLNPNPELIKSASTTGADRIELYTEAYASGFIKNKALAIKPYLETALLAKENGLGINAGHDLSLENLEYLINQIPFINEVSIGHALISDALYLGLENTIQAYLKRIYNGSRKSNTK